jgi:hypothetical protein
MPTEATNLVERAPPVQGRVAREGDTAADTPINMGNAIVAKSLKGIDKANITTDPVQAIVASTPCVYAIVQAASANAGILIVGGADGSVHELYAAQSIPLQIDNVNKIYLKMSAGTGTAHITYFV